ncbi:MAG TPA: helicase-related protein [Spirochaetota bacterium]|nr:helicase-related protein [Spirochaetota bacterium]
MQPPQPDNNKYRYFGGNGAALGVISRVLADARVVRIATAYFEPSGYQCLRGTLRGKEVRLLLGRPETEADRISGVIDEFFEALAGSSFTERTRAMKELGDAIRKGRFLVAVSDEGHARETTIAPRYIHHHAKLYISDDREAVVCSSNFTAHGLMVSREAGIAVTDRDDVGYFVERFDYYFEKAEPVAEELLARLEEWLRIYTPYEIYMRSLLELYGLPDDEETGELPVLSGYQRPVVSRVLRNMEEHGGAMLVASTGLGKTIMAAHVVAYLHMQRAIDKAIVLCPAGLRHMWRRTMRAAYVSSAEFSYYILSVEDGMRYRDIVLLENELKRANKRTIIILDESHHLRNYIDGREIRLRHSRIMDAVEKKTKILLMTATPYSREVGDINAQLMLLPAEEGDPDLFGDTRKKYWSIAAPSEISEIPCSVVLTAPSVVKHFSVHEGGEHYVLFSGNEKRYFPRKIHMRNVYYENPCDQMLIDLLENRLMYVKSDADTGASLFEPETGGERDPLLEARVVHQFCSSLKQIDTLMGKMEREGGFEKLRFADQDRLTEWTARQRARLLPLLKHDELESKDEKIMKVAEIIQMFPDRKAVIFCYYHDTTRYVAESLKSMIPDKKVEHTVERKSDEIEDFIRRFAPVSNSIDLGDLEDDSEIKKGREIDVLVATTALSEGFNFQDASVLINFDLPWTVLVLAQRMGRILRPWKDPREIYIFTLVPSTMNNERVNHATNWKDRLVRRNEELKSFADIPVLVKEQDSELEMIHLAHSVQQIGDVVLDLDQVFEFIENAEHLKTSGFIDDLALLDDDMRKKIMRHPFGIKSCKVAPVRKPSLYVLFSHRTRMFPAIMNEDGSVFLNSNKMDEIMQIIRSLPGEEPYMADFSPDDIDVWLQKACNEWAALNGFMPGGLKIVCYMPLVPKNK